MVIAELARPWVEEVLGPVAVRTVHEDGAITVYLEGEYLKATDQFAVKPALQIGNLAQWNGKPLVDQFAVGADCELCVGRIDGSKCVIGHPERIVAEKDKLDINWSGLPVPEDFADPELLKSEVASFDDPEPAVRKAITRLRKVVGSVVKASITKARR